jgi:hypothetical protein
VFVGPKSNLLLKRDNVWFERLELCLLLTVSRRPSSEPEEALAVPARIETEEWFFSKRGLTPDELKEIRGRRKLLWKGVPLNCFGIFWGTSFILNVISGIIWRMQIYARDIRFAAIPLCVVFLYLLRKILLNHKMTKDIRDKVIAVIREKDGNAAEIPYEETLPHSGLVWTRKGEPAPWRTRI